MLFQEFQVRVRFLGPLRSRILFQIFTPLFSSLVRQHHVLIAKCAIKLRFQEIGIEFQRLIEVVQTTSEIGECFARVCVVFVTHSGCCLGRYAFVRFNFASFQQGSAQIGMSLSVVRWLQCFFKLGNCLVEIFFG